MFDRIVDCLPHHRIVTIKLVSCAETTAGEGSRSAAWFPSLLLLEGLAQSAGALFRLTYGEEAERRRPLLGFLRAELQGSAQPGEIVAFEVEAAKMTLNGGVFQGFARCEGRLLAEAELAFGSPLSSDGKA